LPEDDGLAARAGNVLAQSSDTLQVGVGRWNGLEAKE
jgi:hypothetical protein